MLSQDKIIFKFFLLLYALSHAQSQIEIFSLYYNESSFHSLQQQQQQNRVTNKNKM